MDQQTSFLRLGAVNYLNSKPLIYGFDEKAADARLVCDLPSRLADSLAADRLDVALIPVFECFRGEGYHIASDACVASRGPVMSVKAYFRTPPAQAKTLALDEGSRTSAALCRVMLWRRYGLRPESQPLPIGASLEDSDADVVLLIGDRAMQPLPDSRKHYEEWDLGEEWERDTRLPFVYACWATRPEVDPERVAPLLSRCRDLGIQSLPEIAASEGPKLGLRVEDALQYLQENLCYVLGKQEQQGLEAFRVACVEAGLIEKGALTSIT